MKVKVQNLGILRQAEFSLGDITIICGGNNTGKTYATYALYGFLATWREYLGIRTSLIPERVIDDLREDGVVRIKPTEYAQKAGYLLDAICKNYSSSLSRVFATSEEKFQDSQFRISVESALFGSIKPKLLERRIGPLSFSMDAGSEELEISVLVDVKKAGFPPSLVRRRIMQTINEIIFGHFFPDTFIASAERTGAAIFRKELNFARNRLLKEMSQADDKIDPWELLHKSYQDYPLPVEKNVDFTRQLESVAKLKSFVADEHPEALARFAGIIGGAYRVTRNDELYFTPKGKRVRLGMDESSSGVRSMLDLGFYLRHSAKRGDLLMMDEPELNLHPENQRRIARLFARLANLGIKIFITTHSDYIVKELNTLIMLNQDKPGLKTIAKREGYDDSELIRAEKIKVYIAEKALVQLDGNKRRSRCHTLTEARIDPESGIEARSFDSTIDEMNRIQDAIIWEED